MLVFFSIEGSDGVGGILGLRVVGVGFLWGRRG